MKLSPEVYDLTRGTRSRFQTKLDSLPSEYHGHDEEAIDEGENETQRNYGSRLWKQAERIKVDHYVYLCVEPKASKEEQHKLLPF